MEIEASYAVYMKRQEQDIQSVRKEEGRRIPEDFDYDLLSGLSNELKQKLKAAKPESLAQAGRMEGMTPAALTLLLAHIRKSEKQAGVA